MLESDKPWLRAPEARFETELVNQGLLPSARTEEDNYPDHTRNTEEADWKDFSNALAKGGGNSTVLSKYQKIRGRISNLKIPAETEEESSDAEGTASRGDTVQEILAEIDALAGKGVGEEFVLYLKGAANWRAGEVAAASAFWKELLELPVSERGYRSTWAAYMLARANLNGPVEQAREALAVAEEVIAAGFADSLNLAKEIPGWQAMLYLREASYGKAIELYLRRRDIDSLRAVSEKALSSGTADQLRTLAENDRWQKVVTGFLISGGARQLTSGDSTGYGVIKWAAAIRGAGVKNPAVAERLALACYQIGERDSVRDWIERSPGRPVSRWVEAKIYLENDQVDEALVILRDLGRRISDDSISTELLSNLTINRLGAKKRILAELAVVELHRGHFEPALTMFLKAGYWKDSAFIAERVLMIEELKAFVDKNQTLVAIDDDDADLIPRLRALAGRRYMRMNQILKARPYFTPEVQGYYDEFVRELGVGLNTAEPKDKRARSLFNAAVITRERGDKLFGTEMEPDWEIPRYGYFTLTGEDRVKTEADRLPPSAAEVERIKASELTFSRQYRYRYIAAELGWMASLLMPNNDDETAKVLCESGSWIKNLDAERADKFYKSLVRRNRGTELGAKADKKRWFPEIVETRIDSTTPR